jgi:3-oxoacyl-[acyl-carrier protein] reductase
MMRQNDQKSPAPLAGHVALISGASRGIGRAIAVELGRLGARVAINFRSATAAAEAARREVEAAGGPGCQLFQADVGRSDQANRLVEDVLGTFGKLTVLVNNAGVIRSARLHKMTDEDWHEVINVNLSSAFYLCRAALPSMLAAGNGHIVNVTSASAYMNQAGATGYVASKLGLVGLTRALAQETAGKGIYVNAVAPGATDTDMLQGLAAKVREELLAQVPLKRMAAPEEVARMVAFVIAEARYSTGNVFHVSGGVVMG